MRGLNDSGWKRLLVANVIAVSNTQDAQR